MLTTLEVVGSDACITDLVLSGSGGEALDADVVDCLSIIYGAPCDDADNDGICDDVDDCVGEYDDCGVCNGPGDIYECGCSDIPDGACDCDGNVEDDCGECGGDGSSCETAAQYFTDLPDQTGESSLIIIQGALGLDDGDEVGLFDANGVMYTDTTGTNPQYGEILVGSGVWQNDQLEIVAVLSIDLSDFGGPVLNGAVEGNDILIKTWDESDDIVSIATPNYSLGNGTYGEVLTVIDVLDAYRYGCTDSEALNYDSEANMDDGTCEYTVEQSIDLFGYQMNNISFNVNVSDYEFVDLFGDAPILLSYDSQDQYYVPEFGIDQIGYPQYENGYYVFISGANPINFTVEGEPINLDESITLNPYTMNNIAYYPSENRYAEDVFDGISLLLVSNDQGQYYLPSLGVNTLDAVGGMTPGKGYNVFLSGSDTATLTYGEGLDSTSSRNSNESYDRYFETLTQAYEDIVSPTGISYPIIITELDGDVSVGDELVAYADGQVVGATRISDLSSPVVISAWGGYHEFGIELDGYATGDRIDLRLYDAEDGTELKVNADLDNNQYGVGVFASGTAEVMDMPAVPEEYYLTQNYPNPFNPTTTISFSVPSEGHVQVNVYDITGRLITTLVDRNMSEGYHHVVWDGKDISGLDVSAGLYIYNLQAEGVSMTRKMVLMK